MRAFSKSSGRIAAIVFALGLGAAGLAAPAYAMGRASGPMWTHSGNGGGFPHSGQDFHGRGGWGPGFGAAVAGGIIGGAIIGSAGYPYYNTDPCMQYQDVYSADGAYLGRQLVNTCQ